MLQVLTEPEHVRVTIRYICTQNTTFLYYTILHCPSTHLFLQVLRRPILNVRYEGLVVVVGEGGCEGGRGMERAGQGGRQRPAPWSWRTGLWRQRTQRGYSNTTSSTTTCRVVTAIVVDDAVGSVGGGVAAVAVIEVSWDQKHRCGYWRSLKHLKDLIMNRSSLQLSLTLYSLDWITRITLKIMLFLRPTRGDSGRYRVQIIYLIFIGQNYKQTKMSSCESTIKKIRIYLQWSDLLNTRYIVN